MISCTFLGVAAAAAGVLVPAFGLLSGLVGGVSQVAQAFVLPPLMLVALSSTTARNSNYFFVFVGVAMILWTIYSTLQELMA